MRRKHVPVKVHDVMAGACTAYLQITRYYFSVLLHVPKDEVYVDAL